jgi:UDP-4-amino-4,6-dideoxy-N-acetyl-beta-L-altrosamine transaminase
MSNQSFIPYGRQDVTQQDIDEVLSVLQSDFLTQGPIIEKFEALIAQYCGAKYGVAVANATAALHIACLAAGLSSSDRLWTSPNTFVASANCGLYCGASVDFVDINPHSYNLSTKALECKLSEAAKQNNLPQVLIPVHFAGQSCEMEKISDLVQPYGIRVIEDASHAIGGQYQRRPIGNCTFADMVVFSFHPVKIITTGEGGMVLTNREDLYEQLIRLRSHGITRNSLLMEGESDGPWYYQQIELGYNYRMTDIQAALGVSQLQRLDKFVARRRFLSQRYYQQLQNLPLTLPWTHPDCISSWHLFVIRLNLEKIDKNHRQVFEELRAKEIGVNLHYIPVHTQPYYQKLGFQWGDFPQAEQYYHEAISLPLYYGLTERNQDRVIEALQAILR